MITTMISETKQPELTYFSLPDSEYADVIICSNEQIVTLDNSMENESTTQTMYQYDCNYFRAKITKETIESNLDFYKTFEPETNIDYPTKIAKLESQLDETQLAVCDCYELLEGLTNGTDS